MNLQSLFKTLFFSDFNNSMSLNVLIMLYQYPKSFKQGHKWGTF